MTAKIILRAVAGYRMTGYKNEDITQVEITDIRTSI